MSNQQKNKINQLERGYPRQSFHMQGIFPGLIHFCIEDLDSLDRYAMFSEKVIKSKMTDFDEKMQNYAHENNLYEEELDAYYEYKRNEVDDHFKNHPSFLYQSLLITSCSLFEANFVGLCKHIEEYENITINTNSKDINGDNNINKWAKYLCKNLSVCPQYSVYWKCIQNAYTIRNLFVHANSDRSLLKENQQAKTEKIIKNLYNYDITMDHNMVKLRSGKYARFIISTMKSFLEDFKKACVENNMLGPKFWP